MNLRAIVNKASLVKSTIKLRAISCAVMASSILAPKIIPIAWDKFINPASTKPTVITVIAVLLCTSAVMAIPDYKGHPYPLSKGQTISSA